MTEDGSFVAAAHIAVPPTDVADLVHAGRLMRCLVIFRRSKEFICAIEKNGSLPGKGKGCRFGSGGGRKAQTPKCA